MKTAPRNVVVVGAGLAGLSAAMHLRARGCAVTVLEQRPYVGGLCHDLILGGVRHESGPTVLTMPQVLEHAFAVLGESMEARLRLVRLDPAYRATFADGSTIEVGDEVAKTAASVEAACGAAEAQRFCDFADYCRRLYDVVFEPFMHRNFDGPHSLIGRPLLDLARVGGFRSMSAQVNRRLQDSRTRRLVSFQALYAGLAPSKARALYNVITYMDVISGVYSPVGGMSAIPVAMAAALREHGVTIRTGTAVRSVVSESGRATAVETDEGGIRADAVVLTCDPVPARRLLGLGAPRRRIRRSPSCVLVHLHAPAGLRGIGAHHTIHFGDRWEETFTEIITRHRPMSDPSVLVSAPATSDPSRRSNGQQPVYLLLPCPNEQRGVLSPAEVGGIVASGLQRVRQRGLELDAGMIQQVTSPSDWARAGMPGGTPFSIAHSFSQTGPFRPSNRVRAMSNVVLAGAGTVPGVGVPTAIISGELAAARLTDAGAAGGTR